MPGMSVCAECHKEFADTARFCPFCGAVATGAAAADPYVGSLVAGKFRIEKLLGQGGMGKVYLANHQVLDQKVVLKVLHREYAEDPDTVKRFQHEGRAASRLRHPNVIQVLDFGAMEDGTLFMAMEYLPGQDLSGIIQREFPLGDRRVARIGAQILSALSEAHAQNVIHRDLKPENVMVENRRGEPDFVKVLDFGIAKITDAKTKLTQAGLVCGTPEYMSPEQARGADLDARSDLYSVGVIIYQMVTGLLPFESDTPIGFLMKHLTDPPMPPSQKQPEVEVPPDLEALIMKALSKNPADRFANAEEMREALLACVGGDVSAPARAASAPKLAAAAPPKAKPTPASQAKTVTVDEEPPRKSGGGKVAIGVAAAVLLVGGGAAALFLGRLGDPRPPEPVPAPVAQEVAPVAQPAPPPPAQPEQQPAAQPADGCDGRHARAAGADRQSAASGSCGEGARGAQGAARSRPRARLHEAGGRAALPARLQGGDPALPRRRGGRPGPGGGPEEAGHLLPVGRGHQEGGPALRALPQDRSGRRRQGEDDPVDAAVRE